MKTKFILWLSLLTAFNLIFHSCRTEDMYQENERQKQDLRASVLRFHEISNNTPLVQKVKQLQTELFSSKNLLGKNNSILDGATISTDKVILVENGTQKTYTFPVKRASKSFGLENLVLKQNSDGTFSGVLIQYDITPLEKDLFVLGEEIDMKNKIKIFDINNLSLSQRVATEAIGCYVITWETGVCGSSDQHQYGEACNMTGSEAASAPGIISIVNTCSGGAGGTDTGIPYYPNPDSPGGNTGGYGTLPYSDDSDLMLAKYQQFSNIFHINTYGFTSTLRTKLFYLYLYQYEDQYTVSKLLTYFGTKPDILNNAVDMFTENASLSWDDFYNQFLATPCEKIKAQRSNADFYAKMNVLESNTGLKMETGYIQRNNNDYEYKDNATATETSNSLGLPNANLTANKDIKGYMHTHVDDYTYKNADGDEETRYGIKIFSPTDVIYFMDMVKNTKDENKPLGGVYAVMVSGSVNYQIRFTGNEYQIKTFTDSQAQTLKKSYFEFMKSRINKQKQLEVGFLQFINDKMNLKGVSLYRMNADGTNTEINLNADKTDTTETNC